MAILKQSTAYTRMFLLVQSSDHITGLTGATPTVTVSKAGGAFASPGGTVTEVGNGWYKIALTTTDTNTLGELAYHITATSGDPTDFVDQVCANILGDTLPVNVTSFGGTAVTGRDIGASVLLSAGTGTGQLDFTLGVVKSNLVQILGTALTETAGQIAAAFKQFFNVATPTGTVNSLPNATPGAAGGVFIAGSNATTTVNITGNLSGSVGSVTGAVGSVTGNVGGNVVGSVASVTGAVGSVTGNVGGNVVGSVASVTGAVGSVTAGVTVSTNNDKTGYALTTSERTSIADALLDRDMGAGTDSGSSLVRTVRQSFRALRNKVTFATGTITVFKEDDATTSWTAAATTDGTALPIVTVDPA